MGVIHTPFATQAGTPIQPACASGARGTVELEAPYVEALADLDGFEHVWLLYWLDRAGPWAPRVVPFRDRVERGLFATRAPSRPNPLGLSLVELVAVDGPYLEVRGVDMLDATPLLDIKPYVPEFDARPQSRAGWTELAITDRGVADDRFDGTS